MESNATHTNPSLGDYLPDLPYLDMGSGFIIGMAVGFFFKKSFKILLFIMGVMIVTLFGLEHFHIITIDQSHLQETVGSGTGIFKQFGLFLKNRLAQFGAAGTGSAVAGFLVGLKMG
jgi:uncharacterized membrane protein (Fun14 family)